MGALRRMVFREPDGRRKGLLFSLLSLGCLSGWVYSAVVLGGAHSLLFLALAFACSGVAESLPANLGVVLLLVLLTAAPESVLGG